MADINFKETQKWRVEMDKKNEKNERKNLEKTQKKITI